jgi:hypothetical protein
MRFQPLIRRISPAAAIAAVAGLLLAGCGSSGGSPGSGSSSSPSTSSQATTSSGGSAAAQIKANWEAFFSASTPVSRRVALLQNGQLFGPLISAQAKSAIASSASAKVTKVSNVTATQAGVTYSIIVGGSPALSNQKGVAVYANHVWKVGDASFCGLLTLEKSSGLVKLSALPAACKSAG